MVSVRTTDNAVSRDPDDVIQACDAESVPKLCIGAIDKKVRNLEKRKTKLDGYKQKIAGGEKLAKEQMEALEKYDLVNQNLEFARELQKQIQAIATGTENGRSEDSWSPKVGTSSTLSLQEAQEILMLQSVLRIVQSKQTHLLNGANVLTDEETASLVEFGNLISTSEDISEDCIQMAAGHLCKYLRKDEGEVIGTTYEKIHDAVGKIVDNVRALSCPRSNSQMSSIEYSIGDLKISNDKSATSSEVTTDSSNGDVSPHSGGSTLDNKPLQDILKGMEGEFTFLQESEIYKEVSEQIVESPQVDAPLPNVPTTTDACMPDVNQTSFHMNAHPIENAVFVPKYVTIPLTNTIYAPTNTMPVTHQYAPVPAFTSYDYTIQNPLSFPAVYHHAIINGTTYFQPGAQMYTAHQAPADPYSQIEEYPEAAEAGAAEEVYYPPRYEVPVQQSTFQPQPEEQETENFNLQTEARPDNLPVQTQSHFQQPENDVPSTSPQPPRQTWQFSRGRGGRGSYRGQRNFQNQYRYQRNRPENDQAGGYRGHPRYHRYNNAFHKQE